MMDWVWLGVALYLLLGLWLAFRGRLAFMVNTQGAMLEMQPGTPKWKRQLFNVILRLGVIFFYPIFLLAN